MTEWQPIETAPKDGTIVLLSGPDQKPASGYYQDGWWLCVGTGSVKLTLDPTRWMGLPDERD